MKLLYVCSDFGIRPTGTKGASIHLGSITRALSDLGHDVQLLSPHAAPGDGHPAPFSEHRGRAKVVCRPSTGREPGDNPGDIPGDIPGTGGPLAGASGSDSEKINPRHLESVGYGGEIRDLIRALREGLKARDIPEGVTSEIRSLLYNQWAQQRVIQALQSDPPDAIIERLSLFSYLGVSLAHRFRCPLLLEVNALLTREARRFRHLEMDTLAKRIESYCLHQADAVMAVSNPLRTCLTGLGFDPAKITVVPNGVDVEAFDPAGDGQRLRDELKLGSGIVIGFVGSLKPWHGVDVLITAFAQVHGRNPNARLLIVGAGPSEPQLGAQVAAAGLDDAVVFTGAVEHDRVPQYLEAVDIAVAPFRAMDDFYFSPIKLFEYMAAGCCVVASGVGQIVEVIEHKETGLLCAPDDPDALAAAILTAAGDATLRRRLGAAARGRVETHYTWRAAAQSVAGLIEGACDRNERSEPMGVSDADALVSGGEFSERRGRAEVVCPQSTGREPGDNPSDNPGDNPGDIPGAGGPQAGACGSDQEVGGPTLRVTYLLRMYPRFSQTFVVNEILELERQGVDVSIVSLKRPNDGRFHESVSRVRAKAHYLPEFFVEKPVKTIKAHLATLRRRPIFYARALGAAIRHSGNNWTDFQQAAALLRWVKKHRQGHVHVHFGTHEASVVYLAHLMGGLSYSMTLHAFDIFRDNVDRKLLSRKINASRFTVTVSEFNKRFMLDHLPGVDADKIRVSYNGIDLSLFDSNGTEATPGSILAVGRLIEKKGFIHLVRAVARLRDHRIDASCTIIGDGPQKETLKTEISRLDLRDRVKLAGAVTQHQVRDRLASSACFVLPCVVAGDGNVDALPTVLLEAMGCGCPCVSTRVSGVPEIIEHGASGLLVAPEDDDALADAVARVLCDAPLAARLARNGRKRAERLFDLNTNVARLKTWFAALATSDGVHYTSGGTRTPLSEPSRAAALMRRATHERCARHECRGSDQPAGARCSENSPTPMPAPTLPVPTAEAPS